MKTKKAVAAPNNYINNNYFSFSDFRINKIIDFLKISIREIDDPHFFENFLISLGFKSIRNYKLDKGNYERKWSFKNLNDNVTFDIKYARKSLLLPAMLITIHDPNKEFLNALDSFFIYHRIYPNLSYLELTFDFHTKETFKLKDFIISHLFMKQQRSKSFYKESTFYTNNLRKSTRAMRVYYKKELDCNRMELVLKNQPLKMINQAFPLSSIDSLDLTQFFQFMTLDRDNLEKSMIWRNRKQISELDKGKRRWGSLIKRMIESELRSLTFGDDGRDASLMKIKERLKTKDFGLPNYSRFFVPFDELNTEFHRQVSSQSFLKSRNKGQIGGKSSVYLYRILPKKLI